VLVLWDVRFAFGSTVTVTVNAVPVQLPEAGVTIYVAVVDTDTLLDRLSLNMLLPAPDAPPVRPAPSVGLLHEYVVPVAIVPVGV
jgi:hypothetical protein